MVFIQRNMGLYNKYVDINLNAHDAFLEESSSGKLKFEILESQII
jgi:hypothetical protein